MGAVHDFEKKVVRAELLLEKSPISEENKDLIRRFVEFKTAEKVKLPRIAKYLSTLRLLGLRYLEGRAFAALTKDDIIGIVAAIERSGLSEWTKHDYVLILKTFYKRLSREDLVEWLKIKTPRNKTLPKDLVSEDDVQALIDAARTPRDKALISCLYEGGFRIGELGSLVVKDVVFDKYGAVVVVGGFEI